MGGLVAGTRGARWLLWIWKRKGAKLSKWPLVIALPLISGASSGGCRSLGLR